MRNRLFRSCRAFTLTELLIAMSLSVVVGGSAVWFIVEGTKLSLRANSSSINDLVQWGISSRLQLDSKIANGAVIYASLSDADLTDLGRRRGGERGNVLVLSLSDRLAGSTRSYFRKIIGYRYDPSTRILSKFEHTVSSSQQTPTPADLETIIKTNKSGFQMIPVARDVDSLDSAGPFVCRDVGNINAAAATFQLNQGKQSLWTSDKILVEVSFLIRG
jgi:prepilin-type N-terminal cleavage/methylation domain-containing protein